MSVFINRVEYATWANFIEPDFWRIITKSRDIAAKKRLFAEEWKGKVVQVFLHVISYGFW